MKFLTTEEGQKLVDKLVKKNRGEEVIDLETLFAEDTTPIETNMPCKNHINALVNGIGHLQVNQISLMMTLINLRKKWQKIGKQ